MRFGGHAAAVACFFFIAGGVARPQAPAAPANAADQGAQSQIDNPQSNAQAAQDAQQNVNPTDKTNPVYKPKRTPEEEYQDKIRQYDPLATEDQSGQNSTNTSGSQRPLATAPAGRGAEPAGMALPGPSIGPDDSDAEEQPGYAGPAVLSRSYTLMRPSFPKEEKITPVLGTDAIYDSGIAGVVINSQGVPSVPGSTGGDFYWGVSGRHYFHHDQLGISYMGIMQYYSQATAASGVSQTLSLDYTHAFSRRLSLTLVEMGADYTMNNFPIGNPVIAPTQTIGSTAIVPTPNTQILNAGFKTFTSSADVTYQATARLSFNGGGSWFGVQEQGLNLPGAAGEQGRGDVMYRLTRRTTAGFAWSYNQYVYPQGLGQSTFNTFDGVYSWALSRSVQIHLRGGMSRLNNSGLTSETLPPSIAAILGVTSVTMAYRQLSWVTDFSGQISKDFRRGRSGNLSYSRGIIPGNGLFLTSIDQNVTGGASLVMFRRFNISAGNGYDSLTAPGQNLGSYRSYFAYFGVSRRVTRDINSNFRFDYRRYLITGSSLLQNEFRVSLGFSWSPTEGLSRLW